MQRFCLWKQKHGELILVQRVNSSIVLTVFVYNDLSVQIYVHLKEGSGSDGLDTLKNKPQLHSLVARQLCQNLSEHNTIIFTGPSITSLSLFQEFENQSKRSNSPSNLTRILLLHCFCVSQLPCAYCNWL